MPEPSPSSGGGGPGSGGETHFFVRGFQPQLQTYKLECRRESCFHSLDGAELRKN